MTTEMHWHSIITALKAAEEAGKWAFWQERLRCTHPDHKVDEIDNPTQFAKANWHAAKSLYVMDKDKLDGLAMSYDTPNQVNRKDLELFHAMKMAVEREMEEEIFKLLTRNNMETQPTTQIQESYDAHDFVIDTEDFPIWEGDEYIGSPFDEYNEEI